MLTNPLTKNIGEDRKPVDMSAYEANGGYQGLKKVFDGMSRRTVSRSSRIPTCAVAAAPVFRPV